MDHSLHIVVLKNKWVRHLAVHGRSVVPASIIISAVYSATERTNAATPGDRRTCQIEAGRAARFIGQREMDGENDGRRRQLVYQRSSALCSLYRLFLAVDELANNYNRTINRSHKLTHSP